MLNHDRIAQDINSKSVYEQFHYGDYYWILIVAPIFSGAIAGTLARMHNDLNDQDFRTSIRPLKVILPHLSTGNDLEGTRRIDTSTEQRANILN